ncbi:gliding motility protein [Flavobacterium sp. AS60]|uniref:type IX secretion system periplasmic lipoprotein PorW/SprE n=1 Tax=Flavobacterium anseongense TaxID=2910677 RepID=UPI001F35FE0F|nr:gliding motility protein [Flavobacterium sp. AS60]MCF6129755.1 gliding motility protein [Flavobacterium sp. AS60]
MKINTIKYFIFTGLLLFLIACSTKRNTWLSRNSHALSTKDNILYNGGIALDKGIEEVKLQNKDNFWAILPVERMQVSEDNLMPGNTKNANFERAETKATKAIQKHSMNINGSEKNPQMDEAYMMLGQARYYDQRFVPALDAFNYVLNKSPNSDKIYEVKIWREKTNMRLDNDALAVNNLRKLLKEIKFKDQIFADANATLAQAFLNLQERDSAVAKLKIAIEFTKSKEEISRYNYILGQIYEELGYKDSAYASYQTVIDMRRKAAKSYVIHAHARQAAQFDYEKGDTIAFLKKYNDLLKDRENRPFLDVLHHQLGLFYEKTNNKEKAKKEYNLSLKKKTQDTYLIASNYRNLADLYFIESKFVKAGNYYDSTLVQLKPRTREFNLIKKKRENLEDVIKYEAISQTNDSIISLYKMSGSERTAYFETHIEKLKKEEELQKKAAEKLARIKENQERNDGKIDSDDGSGSKKPKSIIPKTPNPSAAGSESVFYFYNPTTVAYGKVEFAKNWGKRSLQDNWRVASLSEKANAGKGNDGKDSEEDKDAKDVAAVDERFTPDFYIKQIPESQTTIDSLSKERNFANYQLGIIYKEKFKEYQLAANKFEKLLRDNPEERLVLPSMYHLYKLYEILDKSKADAMKESIVANYPNSRYAQILQNPSSEVEESSDSPNVVYANLYKQYQNGEFKTVLTETEKAINRFTGDEIVPKLELLKANIVGKLGGLGEFSTALNYVALNYPNSEEGKKAEKLLSVDLPKLEALQLSKAPSKNWKILYSTKDFEDAGTKALREKIKKFIADRSLNKLTVSLDIYTMTDNFVVLHGINTEDLAIGITSILKDYKEYKVQQTPIIISAENYTIVQIKKNLDEFLAGNLPETAPQPNWDGTLEKAPEPVQQKPVANNNQKGQPSQDDPNEIIPGKNLKGGEQKGGEQQEFALPPSPQMDKSGKKG